MSIERFVLFKTSDTQRVSVQISDTSVLFTKDWRKTPTEDWIVGKGITLPRECVNDLYEILNCHDTTKLDALLAQYESAKEVKSYHGGNAAENLNTRGH